MVIRAYVRVADRACDGFKLAFLSQQGRDSAIRKVSKINVGIRTRAFFRPLYSSLRPFRFKLRPQGYSHSLFLFSFLFKRGIIPTKVAVTLEPQTPPVTLPGFQRNHPVAPLRRSEPLSKTNLRPSGHKLGRGTKKKERKGRPFLTRHEGKAAILSRV